MTSDLQPQNANQVDGEIGRPMTSPETFATYLVCWGALWCYSSLLPGC